VTKKKPKGEPAVAPPEAASPGDGADDGVDVLEDVAPGVEAAADVDDVDDDGGDDGAGEPAESVAEPPAEEPTGDDAVRTDEATEEPEDPLTRAERALAERTLDLQRLQAEYLNYKRRVDRDRELVRENATFAALAPIVEVLDTIDRARNHGDLDPGFKAVADQLERVVADAGLVRYGEPGDAFDPRLHEALSHIGEDPEVDVTTAKVIAKVGYRIGDRVVRVAQVLVVDPPQA
jgi:molecular chaperone GrpE